MKPIIFTIVAKNYIGLAQVLEESVRANHPDAAFFIFVADELGNVSDFLPTNVLCAKDLLSIENDQWEELAFKYNLVEFCTAIKPFCFTYFFAKPDVSKVIYLDPDVFVFNSLEKIIEKLDQYSIVLTPHITNIQTHFKGDYPDYLFLLNGTFNLGFLALKKSETTNKLLSWWQNRLQDQCFFDNDRGMATDQKWMNLIPALFTSADYYVLQDKGMNVAPWNYFERKVIEQNGKLFIANRENENDTNATPLVFVHFSGYDYKSFSNHQIAHKKEDFGTYTDFEIVFEQYANALKAGNFDKYFALPYSYNQFENGKQILSIHRRLFRRMREENRVYKKPFAIDSGSFYEALKNKRLIDHAVVSADKITNKSIQSFDTKISIVNFFFKLIKKTIGIRRYSILVRFLKRFAKEENQVFLLDSEIGKKLQ
jgi:hypothetical protein